MLLGAVAAGLFLAALDTYVVVTLLPRMMTDLGLPIDRIERATPIITGFLLGYIVTMPLLGSVSDAHGRGRVYLISLAAFALGSLLTATAGLASVPSEEIAGLPWLVAGRVLQGLGGGAMVPVALALAADLYPVGARALPLGVISALQETGSVLGPLYGATLTAVAGAASWRLVFIVNLPLVALCAAAYLGVRRAASSAAAPVAPRADGPGVDWVGGALLGLGLGLAVVALYPDDPSTRAVSALFVPLGISAVIVLVVYAVQQARGSRTLIPARLWRSRVFLGANLTNLLVGAGLMVALVDVPILARGVYGLGQLDGALLLARFMVAIPVGALAGGWLSPRLGYRSTALVGLLASAAAFTLMSRWGADELGHRLVGLRAVDLTLALCGLGFGVVIAPVASAILDRADSSEHGLASSLVVLARTIGMLLGLSTLTAFGLHRFYQLLREGPPLNLPAGASLAQATAALQARVTSALVAEYHEIFLLAAAVCAAAAVVALLTFEGGRPDRRREGRPA